MTTQGKHFISIWFFIGILLLTYGILILGAGIYELIRPSPTQVAMSQLHVGIWWGGLLIVIGGFYSMRFWPGKRR